MSTPSTTKIWPIGTLQRSLADKAQAEADGTAVSARDLGARTNGHAALVAGPTGDVLPFVVVTAELRWQLGWKPRTAAERRVHTLLATERALHDEGLVALVADAEAAALSTGPEAVFEGERTVRAMNAAEVSRYAQAVLAHDDQDDWDVDDGPANDPEALEAEYAAEDAIHQAAATARGAGVTAPSPGYVYSVHNPFTSRQTWFVTGADAQAYARAASRADALDGDYGVWSASGPEDAEYWPFKGGRPHAEG